MWTVDLIFVDAEMTINGSCYREVLLTQKLMPVMLEKLRSVESSLSSSKAILLFTECVKQSTFRNDTLHSFNQSFRQSPPNITDLNPVDY